MRASVDLAVDDACRVNAIAVTFRAALYEGIEHTLDPWAWPTSSWATSVWVLPDSLNVDRNETLRVDYSRRVPGTPDGLRCGVIETGR